MIGWLTAGWNRVFAVLGKVSMYRMVFLALLGLTVVAFGVSFFGLVAPSPLELLATLASRSETSCWMSTLADSMSPM